MGAGQGAAAEDGRKEDKDALKMSQGKNDAVQMNENVPAQPAIDEDSSFKASVAAITPVYVGAYSLVLV